MIGHLSATVIDCPDPGRLAEFYAAVLGMWVDRKEDDWVSIRNDSDAPGISFQLAPDQQPPRWPDPSRPQQFHLDIQVEDIEQAEPRVLALGATRIGDGLNEGRTGFRVYADPAGHPFCLVWG